MAGVLADIKVLDLSWGVAGPMTAMLMADHGADVTKIEPPGGDPYRDQMGYRVWQRGKKRAELDLKKSEDLETFLALVRSRDSYRAEATFRSFLFGTARNVLRMHYLICLTLLAKVR